MSTDLKSNIKAILIGTSAGGVSAIQQILSLLPKTIRIPIAIVQHLPADAKIQPALVFGHLTETIILEARDKMPMEPGHVYFAPPGYHLLIEKNAAFALSQDEPVHYARPSIDVFFESAANVFGRHACGVLLTGANSDGALGLQMIHLAGGMTCVQDPRDAEAPMMPEAALNRFQPDLVGNLQKIAEKLSHLIRGEP